MSSLFKKPFQPKKAPQRKNITITPLKLDATERAREFGVDFSTAKLRLNEQVFKFDAETGEWFSEANPQGGSGVNSREYQKVQKLNQQLHEENNLLKLKTEILTDMVAEVYCESKLAKEHKSQK